MGVEERLRINWNDFPEIAMQEYPCEAGGMLYAKRPFSEEQELYVFPVRNVSDEPETHYLPDDEEIVRIAREAEERGLVKLGNVHSHPLPYGVQDKDSAVEWYGRPSETDIQNAGALNDVLRGIVVADKDGVYKGSWYDKHGNTYNIS